MPRMINENQPHHKPRPTGKITTSGSQSLFSMGDKMVVFAVCVTLIMAMLLVSGYWLITESAAGNTTAQLLLYAVIIIVFLMVALAIFTAVMRVNAKENKELMAAVAEMTHNLGIVQNYNAEINMPPEAALNRRRLEGQAVNAEANGQRQVVRLQQEILRLTERIESMQSDPIEEGTVVEFEDATYDEVELLN